MGLENPLSCFQNSLRLAWLQYIEEQNPILRGVSSLKISQLEENLQQNILLKQTLSQEILRLKLREQTYQELEFNRLKNRVTFRTVPSNHQKKKDLVGQKTFRKSCRRNIQTGSMLDDFARGSFGYFFRLQKAFLTW